MILYGVYKNIDMTEGRGPMVLESLWFSKEKAVKRIQKISGVDKPHGIGNQEWYGSFHYIKELHTADELSGFVVPGVVPGVEKYKADFLWPHEDGTVEEAGYEFANARTEEYRQNWWRCLVARVTLEARHG